MALPMSELEAESDLEAASDLEAVSDLEDEVVDRRGSGAGAQPDPRIGTQVAHIRIVGLVGQGAMGTVYEGWDEKLHRRVAVKAVSRHYRGNASARARFLREARLLSKVQHPNICQIHELVEGPDGDYLVLELIEGRSLLELLREKGALDPREGLDIARQLAEALAAAHLRGIAHRDLKPGNVMITPDGTVKVLDFGLALPLERAVERKSRSAGVKWSDSGSPYGPGGEHLEREDGSSPDDMVAVPSSPAAPRSKASSSGSRIIEGTLPYMSPEQARCEPANAASDIYSFGLLLQEMFTGSPCYRTDLPLTFLLVKVGRGETLPVEGLDSDLTRLIERMKSLALGARPSALDVADRLDWIDAKPARRIRAVVIGAFMALLVAFSAVMAVQRVRIAEEAARANREAESARQVTEYLKSVFEVADPWTAASADVTVRSLLERGTDRIRTELGDQPLIRARLLSTMGEINCRLGHFDEARSLLEESLDLQSDPGVDRRDLASTFASLAGLDSSVGNYHDSAAGYRRAIELQRETLGPKHPDLARSILELGYAEHRRGNSETALALYSDALEMFEETSGPRTLDIADVLSQFALTMSELGRYAEAEAYHRRTLEIREALLPETHPDLGLSYYNLGAHYRLQGMLEQALPLLLRDLEISEAALGPNHPDLAFGYRNLAATLMHLGRLREAEEHARRGLELRRAGLPPGHHMISGSLGTVGRVSLALGRAEDALQAFRDAVEIDRAHGDSSRQLAASLLGLAEAQYDAGQVAEATETQRRALEIRIADSGVDHVETARARLALGRTLLRSGHFDESRRHLRQSRAVAEKHAAEHADDPSARHLLAQSLAELAEAEGQGGNRAATQPLLSRGLSLLDPAARDTDTVFDDMTLVQILLASGRADQAEPLARDLLAKGFASRDFLERCREQGWTS